MPVHSLVQLRHPHARRAVASVEDNTLILLAGTESVYALVQSALGNGIALSQATEQRLSSETLRYDEVYAGASDWKLLPPIDHPAEPARLLLSGTGLTHKASVDNRNAMHDNTAPVTDSMRMYQWGLESGHPEAGKIGASPEWFYKGTGTSLRAHGDPLDVPAFAEDGGEEPEVAGVYIIDSKATPRRIGMAQCNEFSDHVLEKRNYLYLAPSKLRTCSLGPELILNPDFRNVPGRVKVSRNGATLWLQAIATGEDRMCHSRVNIEHHHFKFLQHRRPGDVHVHFFGADAFSFGAGIRLQDGDEMEVAFTGFGRPLRNTVSIEKAEPLLVTVETL